MTSSNLFGRAQELLRQMLGPQAQFREGQWQAIDAIIGRRGRVLVVQRTGWGKSLVHFLPKKLLREQSAGPTILVSPLLSLMRNQIEAASRIGVAFSLAQAFTPGLKQEACLAFSPIYVAFGGL